MTGARPEATIISKAMGIRPNVACSPDQPSTVWK
jgi:hypothetical protein